MLVIPAKAGIHCFFATKAQRKIIIHKLSLPVLSKRELALSGAEGMQYEKKSGAYAKLISIGPEFILRSRLLRRTD